MTMQEYLAYEARRAMKWPKVVTPESAETVERDLHYKIREECRSRGWICLTGSMAHRAMRTVGENDFHCLLPGGIVLFVECKTKTGKLSTEQLGLQMWMQKLGHTMHVVRSIQEFLALAESALKEKGSASSESFPCKESKTENLSGSANAGVEGK